ncbi:MAG: hypothetical protein JJE29_06395 [Peptostreptococcaceae bacterium]|nr:hypothetical protein [Peptostreptococcaceae bacterium]
MAKPKVLSRYEAHDVAGVMVYMNKSAKAKESGIVIYVERFLWIKRLEVRGLKL